VLPQDSESILSHSAGESAQLKHPALSNLANPEGATSQHRVKFICRTAETTLFCCFLRGSLSRLMPQPQTLPELGDVGSSFAHVNKQKKHF
jgi:hypothetical protein